MKTTKNFLAAASVSLALALTFSGCSSDGDNGVDYSSSSSDAPSSSSVWQSVLLSASETEFLVTDETETVYFYAEVDGSTQTTTVNLVDSNGNVVAEMKDDGQYPISGDDIQNDGVFSIKLEIDLSTAGTPTYKAIAQIDGKNIVSDVVTIYIIAPLTEQDFADMAIVDTEINALRASGEYAEMNIEEKVEALLNLLAELAERGLIIEDSINRSSTIISFMHSCGLSSSIQVSLLTAGQNGAR